MAASNGRDKTRDLPDLIGRYEAALAETAAIKADIRRGLAGHFRGQVERIVERVVRAQAEPIQAEATP